MTKYYKNYKVFDVQNKTKPLSTAGVTLRDLAKVWNEDVRNDSYYRWYFLNEDPDEYEHGDIIKVVNKWLLDSGADEGETVIIDYWW